MLHQDAAPEAAAIDPPVTIAAHRYNQPNRCWTEKQDAQLRDEWGRKVSCRAIAENINNDFGTTYTKNSIIGRASRLGLPSNKYTRPWRQLHAAIRHKRLPRKLALPPPSPDRILPPQSPFLGLSLMQLTAVQCHHPDGDGPFLFCGQPTKRNSAYCNYHHELNHAEPRNTMRPIVAAQSNQLLEAAE